MDSFELNKVLGAVLGTCLFLLAVHIASGAIFTPPTPAKPGYEIAVPETPAGGGGTAAPAEVPIETMLPGASIKQGHSGRQGVPSLPYLPEGPSQQCRPEFLRRRRAPGRVHCRLQLLGRR